MSDQIPQFLPGADLFLRMWTEFAEKMVAASTPNAGNSFPDLTRQLRSTMFKTWSDYWDQAMRSPQFLDGMKQSMNSALEARKLFNDFWGRVQHEFQAASRQDIDQIMLGLQHLERRIVDSSDRLASQIRQLRRRLEALEKRGNRRDSANARRKRKHRDED